MRRQPEVPRWRRTAVQPAPAPVRMSARAARRYAREMHALQAVAPRAAQPAAHPGVTGSTAMAKSGGFRFRRHLIPFAWLALLAAALAMPPAVALLAGPVTGVLVVAFSWRLSRFARTASRAAAGITAGLMPFLSLFGWTRPWPVILVACWLAVTVPWIRHYAWRPSRPEPRDTTDQERWEQLATEKKWNGTIGVAEMLSGGGRRYPILLDGIKTTIGNVLRASENVAGAWHKPMTEAYAERSPDGITSRGFLTILGQDTLMSVREWDGSGINPADGTAVVGRYADGKPARVKFYTPRYGTRHALISGTTGAGKTAFLDLLICIALTSGFIVPVVLDPQEGQSLPFWRDKLLYASGVGECVNMLRGLHAGMLDRSAYLAGLDWDDDGVPMHGMNMFDHDLTGLRVVMPIFDEAHMVLTGKDKECREALRLTVEMGRLGRKTGLAMWLDTHLPSLSDLGGEQALRDMLRGGNVLGLRSANNVAAGMLSLEKDPGEIPMYFMDGKETYGLGYLAGPDNRPDAPMRTDLVPKAIRSNPPAVPALDDRFAAAMARAMTAPSEARPAPRPLAVVTPEPEDAPAGRSAADAVWAVLENGDELGRGEIFKRAAALATGQWERARPFSLRAVQDALDVLCEGLNGRRVVKVRHGTYKAARVAAGTGTRPDGG